MFEDADLGSIQFSSKPNVSSANATTLTPTIEYLDSDVQTDGETKDSSMQTENATTTMNGGKHAKGAVEKPEEREGIKMLLQRVGPLMLHEVNASAKLSSYFTGFERFLEESGESDITKLFVLSFDYDSYFQLATQQSDKRDQASTKAKQSKSRAPQSSLQLSCTGVSWNASGAMLAVAYGRFDHTGWCNYRSALCLWRVFQADFIPSKPHMVLETSSGLMCVACHPHNPSIIAAGSYNGEVFVWDVEHEDYRFFASGIGDFFHREPVTKVSWVFDNASNEYNIASVSGDGKVLFWRLKDKLAFPTEGYLLRNPAKKKALLHSKTGDVNELVGGKALAFSPLDRTSRSFVAGSDGGAVTRCFAKHVSVRASDFKGEKKWTATAAKLVGRLPTTTLQATRRQVETYASSPSVKTKEISLSTVYSSKLDPNVLFPSGVDFVLAPHNGPVYDIQFSPFKKSLLLSCSADGSVHLSSYLQREPLLSIDVTSPSNAYLYAISWSKTRPMVFAVAAEDGNVYLYDLKRNRISPVAVLGSQDAATRPSTASSNQKEEKSRDKRRSSASSSSNAKVATTASTSSPMFAIDFNPKQRNFLAAGDKQGAVHVWKLSWQLSNLQSGETSLLDDFESNDM